MMRWYYKTQGAHTHVRVFMNGAKCGDLCFRDYEFEQVRNAVFPDVEFISEADALIFRDPCTPRIECRNCKIQSYNPSDIEERYCGNCHKFHGSFSFLP